jgi:hypothetical protein
VLVYVATRLIPLPGASGPEEVDALGIAATGLELAAVLLLAVALPEPATSRRQCGAPLWWGLGGVVVFALLWLILIGVVQWTHEVYASSLTWAGTGSWSALTPILVGSPLPHVWLAAPVCCSASTPLLALLGVPLFLGVLAAPFAALLSAVLLALSLVALSVRGARATCTPGDRRRVGASCEVGGEKEKGNTVIVPGTHPGRRGT